MKFLKPKINNKYPNIYVLVNKPTIKKTLGCIEDTTTTNAPVMDRKLFQISPYATVEPIETRVKKCSKAAQDAGYQYFALGSLGSKYTSISTVDH